MDAEALFVPLLMAGYLLAGFLILHQPRLLAARSARLAEAIAAVGPPWLAGLQHWRQPAFAVLNLIVCYVVFFRSADGGAQAFATYVGFVLAHWGLVHLYNRSGNSDRRLYWAVFFSPLVILLILKFEGSYLTYLGVSYMCFRLSFIGIELKHNTGLRIPLGRYLAFAFFVPTIPIGPISRYSSYHESISDLRITQHNLLQGGLRVLIGYVKFKVLATFVSPLTFTALWGDGFLHTPPELLLSCFAYYLYLYLNFSGFCDMAIGAGAMLGIRVDENFDRPYVSRNLREFWSRWHMSLSFWLRDAFYTPVTMGLLRRFGARWTLPVAAGAAFATLFLVGVWLGIQPGFLIFGTLQGLGVMTVYFYGALIDRMPRDRRRAYRSNTAIRCLSMSLTHTYFAMTMFFFENNTWQRMKHVLDTLVW